MRVLRVFHSAAVRGWRGREDALRARGVDVSTITAERWNAGGVPVTLRAEPEEHVIGVRTWGHHPALFLYDPRALWRALGERWDLIDIHEEPLALSTAEILLLRALRRQRAPYTLYTAQNIRKKYPFPFGLLERRALHSASGISACNRQAAAIAEAKGFPGRARVIPLGVAVSPGATAARRPAPTPDVITVGLLGRLVPEKGVRVLLDALALDSALRARIAGTGPLAAGLQEDAAARGIGARVELLGGIDPAGIASFYESVDVLAVPSLPTPRWTEQFGRVAVEAMAHGVPVVSSDAGALPEVVGGAGIVIPHGDAGALARALRSAATEQRDELREAGLARVAECSWERVGAAYEDMYRSALSSSAATESPSPDGEAVVEVIVVAYGAPELLERALIPVAGLPVTVVDNSSHSEISDLCARLGIRCLDPGRNLGFGAAVNLALADRLRPGADVLLLNPDARVDPQSIRDLQTALRANPSLASVGPAQIDEQGDAARVEWVFPSPGRAWLEAVGLGRLIRGPRFVIGSVLLLRAEALEHVGGFDERFFLYAEETDWAYRAHLLGWRHRSVPAVKAVHTGAGTSTDPSRREAFFHASQERYYRKHFGAAGWAAARAAQWLGASVRGVLLRGERGDHARRRARIYRLGPVRLEARWRGAS